MGDRTYPFKGDRVVFEKPGFFYYLNGNAKIGVETRFLSHRSYTKAGLIWSR